MKYIFITSDIKLIAREGDTEISVIPYPHLKCDRCWHYAESVGSINDHPSICTRCFTNLFGQGELRIHA